jgi:hypothetical protein
MKLEGINLPRRRGQAGRQGGAHNYRNVSRMSSRGQQRVRGETDRGWWWWCWEKKKEEEEELREEGQPGKRQELGARVKRQEQRDDSVNGQKK